MVTHDARNVTQQAQDAPMPRARARLSPDVVGAARAIVKEGSYGR